MNKIINHKEDMVSEMVQGYLSFYPKLYERVPGTDGIVYKGSTNRKVSIVIAGGAGNEPWVMGFVGKGLADGAALGQVYTAPPSRHILKVTKQVPHDRGVLYIAANHTGDVLNFELVRELAQMDGIKTLSAYVHDDISTAPKERKEERRGIAGIAFVVRLAGAASEQGLSLEETAKIVRHGADNTYTYSVTTSCGYLPGSGEPMFELPEGYMEYGMGFNGETGVRSPLKTADDIAEELMDALIKDIGLTSNHKIAVMLNGFGFTSKLELCIAGRKIMDILKQRNIKVHDSYIDSLFSPQGTGGFSVSILVLDDMLIPFYGNPFYSPFFQSKGGVPC